MSSKLTPKTAIRILTIRERKVVLDSDLAAIYGVTTGRFNEAVKRNARRFPEDFSFVLTAEEQRALRSQIAILKPGRGRHRKYLPRVFTEHGALMAATILNSNRAVAMSVYVIRAFVELRDRLTANAAIIKRLAEIDRDLILHDAALGDIYQKLLPLHHRRSLRIGKSVFRRSNAAARKGDPVASRRPTFERTESRWWEIRVR